MNKLVAVFSSVAVCVSAVAVSVLSYFSHPVETEAAAPDTSSLVTTSLSSSGSYPTITFPTGELILASSDLYVGIRFCPTGWDSSSTYVSPSSYGTYSNSYYFTVELVWEKANKRFVVYSHTHFDSGLQSRKIFSGLHLSNVYGVGGLDSQDIRFSRVNPTPSATNSYYLSIAGTTINPSTLPAENVIFTLTGIIGNDYDLYLSSLAYATGNSDGMNEGYNAGFDEGQDLGYSNGYSVGVHDASSQFGMWDLFSNAFGSFGNILGIQIFPGFTVGLLISVPIAFAFILWLIHVLKG